ncbi:RNA 3'-terminal phosphate cyclase [Pseudomonas sp. PA15(2017)]|uniref:RNA 3'-terminal phosphate cyclase n=1 Tax=Pseudomonas sp. PA15(2017) TaxID=1932111 RepID=UPI002113FBDC|nr:RNA 3'-terminal phosphate cyclase [Pseudomonas sp. PA15(2017)]
MQKVEQVDIACSLAQQSRQIISRARNAPGATQPLDLFLHLSFVDAPAFGQNGVRAEAVADRAIEPLRQWLVSGAAVGEYLADQLLLPMALAGSGSFTTTHLSEHLQSNIQVIEAFCPVAVRCMQAGKVLRVEVDSRA